VLLAKRPTLNAGLVVNGLVVLSWIGTGNTTGFVKVAQKTMVCAIAVVVGTIMMTVRMGCALPAKRTRIVMTLTSISMGMSLIYISMVGREMERFT